jgi:hypothetical protein
MTRMGTPRPSPWKSKGAPINRLGFCLLVSPDKRDGLEIDGMSNGYSSSSGRRGLTLVEVIAGLVLLATLLTSVLAAFKTQAGQIRAARDRLKASELAEGLLGDWMARDQLPPVGTQKPLANTDGWMWRVLANETQLSGPAPLRTVRVEICRPPDASGAQILASVSLVVQGTTVATK